MIDDLGSYFSSSDSPKRWVFLRGARKTPLSVARFAVVFSISGSDAKLMPDLSAAVDVDVAEPSGSGGFE